MLLVMAVLMGLLPAVACGVELLFQGRGGAYLPASEWNDELFYYKQVEAIADHGYPLGYFGFNESHALRLSFAAWSPVLVWPWILWGKLFHWALISPMLCNLLLYCVVMFFFVVLVKPGWKQWWQIAALFLLFTPNVRYILSGMPEVICFSMVILLYGLTIAYVRQGKFGYLVAGIIAGMVMTWMRPYLVLFLLLPLFFFLQGARKGKRWIPALISGSVLVVTLVVYALIKHYLSAEYFAPLFFTDWITDFFENGPVHGIRNFFGTLWYKGKDFVIYMIDGLRSDRAAGVFFLAYVGMGVILLCDCVGEGIRISYSRKQPLVGKPRNRGLWIVKTHLLISYVCMFFALLLMYKLTEGSKHLLTFLAGACFVLACNVGKRARYTYAAGALFLLLFGFHATSTYDFRIPTVGDGVTLRRLSGWEETFAKGIALKTEESAPGTQTPTYENTVIWVFSDTVGEKSINTDWQMLYALPSGCGISCCYRDYVLEHFDSLQSRYLAVTAGGEIDAACAAAGYGEVGRDGRMVVYDRSGNAAGTEAEAQETPAETTE